MNIFFPKFVHRSFHTTQKTLKKVIPTKLKGKSSSSQNHWLTRQLSDPFIEKAKMLNYRCRSAFKLLELEEKHKLFYPGQTIIDCGASPGSWTQVAVKYVNADNKDLNAAKGTVISIDKQQIYPIDGAIILGNADFTKNETQDKIKEILNNGKVDGVLSDMAPNATGVKDLDNENIINLCYSTLRFAVQVSKVSGFLIVKLWQCGETNNLQNDLNKFYKSVKIIKPSASRTDSAEIFLLAKNFKGLKN